MRFTSQFGLITPSNKRFQSSIFQPSCCLKISLKEAVRDIILFDAAVNPGFCSKILKHHKISIELQQNLQSPFSYVYLEVHISIELNYNVEVPNFFKSQRPATTNFHEYHLIKICDSVLYI